MPLPVLGALAGARSRAACHAAGAAPAERCHGLFPLLFGWLVGWLVGWMDLSMEMEQGEMKSSRGSFRLPDAKTYSHLLTVLLFRST